MVSRARVTVVVLGPDRRPAQVPESVREVVLPEALETPHDPPANAWSRTIQVRPSDLDALQHVNHARYVDFFDDTHQLAEADGAYGDSRPGELRQVSIEYLREAKLGRDLTCLTWCCSENARGFALNDADGAAVARATILLRPA